MIHHDLFIRAKKSPTRRRTLASTQARVATLPISKIKVRSRYRKDLGDLAALAASIKELGLLHPVVVRGDGRLIAGERRLQACKLLGWKTVPVTVTNIDEIIRGEFAENAHRKDFLPSEIDAIRRALEPAERAAARNRMAMAVKGAKFRTLPGPLIGLAG